jgi:hypothetical protein
MWMWNLATQFLTQEKTQPSICSSLKSFHEIAKGGHWQNNICKNNWIASMKILDDDLMKVVHI